MDWGADMTKLRLLAPQAPAVSPLPQWETLARPFPVEECGLWPLYETDVSRRHSVYVAAAEGRYMVYVVEGDLVARQCQVEAPARAGDDLRTLTLRTERLARQIARRAARDLAREIEARAASRGARDE